MYKFTAEYRNTRMGGEDLTIILDAQGKELQPNKSIRTKTGHHGTDVWILKDGVYYIKELQISNTGKERERVRMVKITRETLYILKEEIIRDDYIGVVSQWPSWFPGTGVA